MGTVRKILPSVLLLAISAAAFLQSASVGWKIFTVQLLFVALWNLVQTITDNPSKRLTRTITVAQAESEHFEIHESPEWRGLLGMMRDGDTLWKFVSPAQQSGGTPCDVGIGIVRAGKIADSILVSTGKRKTETRAWICMTACRCRRGPGNLRKFKGIGGAAN